MSASGYKRTYSGQLANAAEVIADQASVKVSDFLAESPPFIESFGHFLIAGRQTGICK